MFRKVKLKQTKSQYYENKTIRILKLKTKVFQKFIKILIKTKLEN